MHFFSVLNFSRSMWLKEMGGLTTHDTSIFCLVASSVDCGTWVGFSVSHLQVNGEIEIWFLALSLRLHEQSLGLRQVDLGGHGFMMSDDVLCSFDFSLLELLMISNDRFRSDNEGSWCCPWGEGGRRTRVAPGFGEPMHKETTKRHRFFIKD